MTTPADPIGAVVAFLRADSATAALAGTAIYGGEMPLAEARLQPRHAIVLRASGGAAIAGDSYAGFDSQRFDLFAYGPTIRQAEILADTAGLALRALRPSVWNGTRLTACNAAGGSTGGREPGTEWPRAFRSWQLLHGLESA